ncbi:hypothetical protein LZ30DRAFT_422991 [Colletotrichum cereale]|nr:hypothetical protein LZ30DRAFT_422991 [Colletotrichum cereale]
MAWRLVLCLLLALACLHAPRDRLNLLVHRALYNKESSHSRDGRQLGREAAEVLPPVVRPDAEHHEEADENAVVLGPLGLVIEHRHEHACDPLLQPVSIAALAATPSVLP